MSNRGCGVSIARDLPVAAGRPPRTVKARGSDLVTAPRTFRTEDVRFVRVLEINGAIVTRIYFKRGRFCDVKSDLNQAYSMMKDAAQILLRRWAM
jgi:hypothetical protein